MSHGIEENMFLTLQNVSFAYDQNPLPLLSNVSMSISPGMSLCLLGPNGAGKSTLISLMAGLLSPNSGRVLLENEPVAAMEPRRLACLLACVPQNHQAFFPFSVREIMLMGRTPHLGRLGLPTQADEQLLSEIASSLHLGKLLDRQYNQISGGEMKRVILARALMQQAPLLLLDEPDAHLDLTNQYRFMDRVSSWMQTKGNACIFSTHNPDMATRYSSHCALIGGPENPIVFGPTRDVVTRSHLANLYKIPFEILTDSAGKPVFRVSPGEFSFCGVQ
ncbi:MAG: ABC transporter ATP-binding protein [Candidatus Ozemobacteraceae bacterium]